MEEPDQAAASDRSAGWCRCCSWRRAVGLMAVVPLPEAALALRVPSHRYQHRDEEPRQTSRHPCAASCLIYASSARRVGSCVGRAVMAPSPIRSDPRTASYVLARLEDVINTRLKGNKVPLVATTSPPTPAALPRHRARA